MKVKVDDARDGSRRDSDKGQVRDDQQSLVYRTKVIYCVLVMKVPSFNARRCDIVSNRIDCPPSLKTTETASPVRSRAPFCSHFHLSPSVMSSTTVFLLSPHFTSRRL